MKRAHTLEGGGGKAPAALRRNYSRGFALHDASAAERDATLSRLLGQSFAVVCTASGAVRKCSEGLAGLVGLEPSELCGRTLASCVQASDAAAVSRAVERGEAFAGPVALCNTHTRALVQGELYMPKEGFCASASGAERLALFVDDAHGVSALELERLASCLELPTPLGPQLAETLDGMHRTFIVTDPNLEDNPIVFASKAFCEMTGYAFLELVGRNCRLLQGPGTDLSQIKVVRRAVAAGEPCTAELLNYRKDGSAFRNLLHFAPVRDPSGRVAYFVGVQTDLSQVAGEQVLRTAPVEAAGAARSRAPASVRELTESVDLVLSQHLRDILGSSMLMHG